MYLRIQHCTRESENWEHNRTGGDYDTGHSAYIDVETGEILVRYEWSSTDLDFCAYTGEFRTCDNECKCNELLRLRGRVNGENLYDVEYYAPDENCKFCR